MTFRDFMALQDLPKLNNQLQERIYSLQEQAAVHGAQIDMARECLQKIEDVLEEVEQTIHGENADKIAKIRGDILFCLMAIPEQKQ